MIVHYCDKKDLPSYAVKQTPYTHTPNTSWFDTQVQQFPPPYPPHDGTTIHSLLPVVVLADGAVCGRFFPEGHEGDAPGPAVGTVDDSAPHHSATGAELRSKKIQADLVVKVGDQQLHLSRTRWPVDPSVHRAGLW